MRSAMERLNVSINCFLSASSCMLASPCQCDPDISSAITSVHYRDQQLVKPFFSIGIQPSTVRDHDDRNVESAPYGNLACLCQLSSQRVFPFVHFGVEFSRGNEVRLGEYDDRMFFKGMRKDF